ncbi:hypothetical protein JCM4814A_76010 [Streptomyces phaeofaciens JCM 4814]|uniref:Preprotein translocase subunit SecB n=1 Tax=Streptomyces phaeofaciens TaxID=68254 RepID=A0A918LXL3_9ACTN|nr:protein-export chaperone SecB [Streptomyces phaeofaciens]GGT64914.1 hypothetical protein GCM10010226_48450 [Streptomyces phaeofaciens]
MPFLIELSKDAKKLAASVGSHARLEDIRVLEIHGKVLDPQAAEELSPVSQLNTTVTVAVTEDSLLYRFRHEFTIKGKDEKDAVHISLELGIIFNVSRARNAEIKFSEEAVTAFGRSTAMLAVYPYIRSAVSDLTVRLGCPPATLDLLALGEDEDE